MCKLHGLTNGLRYVTPLMPEYEPPNEDTWGLMCDVTQKLELAEVSRLKRTLREWPICEVSGEAMEVDWADSCPATIGLWHCESCAERDYVTAVGVGWPDLDGKITVLPDAALSTHSDSEAATWIPMHQYTLPIPPWS